MPQYCPGTKGPVIEGSEYPLISYYLKEIRKSFACPLALILMYSTLAELIMREKQDYRGRDYCGYLARLVEKGFISQDHFYAADEIRQIRNLYMHLDFRKLIEAGFSGIETDEIGFLAFLNEDFVNSPVESEVVPYFKKMVGIHSKQVSGLFRILMPDL